MKTFPKSFKKSQKAQVLVLVALTLTGLVAIIGLTIDMGYMYVSYARLRRAVDAAALAGSGEFKRNYTAERLQGAAEQVLRLNLNGVGTSDASIFPVNTVETCDTVATAHGLLPVIANLTALVNLEQSSHPGQEVCTDPLRKIVRVTVTENIQTFFLAVIGWRSFPIQVVSISEAATVDVALVIDTSESMTFGWANEMTGDNRDPSRCNIDDPTGSIDGIPGSCFPFQDVKKAAAQFIENLYFPYDRVSVITFAKDAVMALPMSGDHDLVKNAILYLQVFQANHGCPYTIGQVGGDPALALPLVLPIGGDDLNPCRLYSGAADTPPNTYQYLDCPGFYGLHPDASACPTTNTSDGVAMGGAILTGDYSSTTTPGTLTPYPKPWPAKRENALWVMLLLTDGTANSGHDSDGSRICPTAENNYAWFDAHPLCRDADTLTRHCASAGDLDCVNALFPAPAVSPALGGKSVVSPAFYDGDDRARDMFDVVSTNSTLIFTIGMGAETKKNTLRYDINGKIPGETLLQYGAYGTTNDMTNANALKGLYYYGNNSSDLSRIFLAIANNLATRINQ